MICRKLNFLLGALALVVTLSGCASILVQKGLCPKYSADETQKLEDRINSRVPGIIAWRDSLVDKGVFKDTVITRDGLKLVAYYAPAAEDAKKTAIITHGYTANPATMMMIARMFRDSLGYNVLLPALRHHDRSEGESIQMGWFDRLDVLNWGEIAHEKFGDTLQVFHGISMGAATTMMLSGEKTPDYVKGFVEDCGYTNVWDEFEMVLKEKFKLGPNPTLVNAEKICKERFGWDFHEASCEKQLAKCDKPMLFIHGGADTFVPTEMVYKNYEAKTKGYKELWIAPDSAHAMSYPDHPAEYTARVRAFLKNQVENR